MTGEEFVSQEELHEKFEVDLPFHGNDPRVAIGRFEWSMTRKRAEFLLFLSSRGMTKEMLLEVFNAYQDIEATARDFVLEGLRAKRRNFRDSDYHPLDTLMTEATVDPVDELDEMLGSEESLLPYSHPSEEYWENLTELSDEEVLQRLHGLKKSWDFASDSND